METLIRLNVNISKVLVINRKLCPNCMSCQIRHSRQSVAKHKQLMKIRKDFIIEKRNPEKSLSIFESPFESMDAMDGKRKTSITVDILGSDTFPQLTDWRKSELIKRARRQLALPVSLTGLGDGQMPRFWRQLMKKTLFKFNKRDQIQELTTYEKIPVSLRLLIDNFPEKVQKLYPQVYETYLKSKEEFFNKIQNNEKELSLKRQEILQFPYELTAYMKEKQNKSLDMQESDENSVKDVPRFKSGLVDTEYENYLKHHHLMQYFATSLKGIKHEEYEGEIEGWSDQFWIRYSSVLRTIILFNN